MSQSVFHALGDACGAASEEILDVVATSLTPDDKARARLAAVARKLAAIAAACQVTGDEAVSGNLYMDDGRGGEPIDPEMAERAAYATLAAAADEARAIPGLSKDASAMFEQYRELFTRSAGG